MKTPRWGQPAQTVIGRAAASFSASALHRLVDPHEDPTVGAARADGDRPCRSQFLGLCVALEQIGRQLELGQRRAQPGQYLAQAVLADPLE
jgi:hypothetical protein